MSRRTRSALRRSHALPGVPAADPNRDFVVALALSKIHRLAVADDPKLEDVTDALPPLRLLLIDDNLKLCATSHGVKMRVPLANTSYLDAHRPMSALQLGVGGDCRLWGGRYVGGVCTFKGHATPIEGSSDTDRYCTLDRFLSQTTIVVDGQKFSREQILRYLTNKIWVHYDPDRSSEKIRPLDLARTSVAVGVAAGADDVSYHLSGAANPWGYADEPTLFKNELDCVHLQAVIACQLLMRSPSVLELIDLLQADESESLGTLV